MCERGQQAASGLAVAAFESRLPCADPGAAIGRVGCRGTCPSAPLLNRTTAASGFPLGADPRTEVHHRLIPSPALAAGHQRIGHLLRLCRPQPTTRPAGQYPAHVGVDDAGVDAESKRLHCPRCVRPHAGQSEQVSQAGRNVASMALGNDGRRSPQAAGASWVTESLPQGQHRCQVGSGAAWRRWPSLHERRVVRHYSLCLRLLQHDLRDQHQPRIACAPPRQVALKSRRPPQQRFRSCGENVAIACVGRRFALRLLAQSDHPVACRAVSPWAVRMLALPSPLSPAASTEDRRVSPARRRPRRCRGSGARALRFASRS